MEIFTALLAFVWGIQRSPVNSQHKGPVTRKMFPFGDVITIKNCYNDEKKRHKFCLLSFAFISIDQLALIYDDLAPEASVSGRDK